MAILVQSKTKTTDKNRWGTSRQCYLDAEKLFGRKFNIDVAAEPATAKNKNFFVSPDFFKRPDWSSQIVNHAGNVAGVDALAHEWADGWFCNPPFDLKQQFIIHALEQAKAGRSGMLLLPHEPLTIWWRSLIEDNATAVYLPSGRYSFLETDGITKKENVNFGSVLVLFTPHYHRHTQYIPFNRYFATSQLTINNNK